MGWEKGARLGRDMQGLGDGSLDAVGRFGRWVGSRSVGLAGGWLGSGGVGDWDGVGSGGVGMP